MNWDQIENKWVAMTRRVRPDWPGAAQDGKAPPARRQGGTSTTTVSVSFTTGQAPDARAANMLAPETTAPLVE